VTVHESTSAPRAALVTALGRLWICGLLAAAALGSFDVAANAPRSRWFEAGEIVAIWALLGGVAALAALPAAAALLLMLRPRLGLGRAAAALLGTALAAVVVLALEHGLFGPVAAFVALGLSALLALRSAALRSFERPGRSRRQRGTAAAILLLLAAAPPIGRRAAAPDGPARTTRDGGRPDVVLIVLDTLRADHLGAYGDRRSLTPRFDALAREGALYARCFSSAPWTVPSHASLFTGLHPPSHGCSFEHHRWLDDDFTTLAEALAERDYRTAAFVANDYLRQSNLLQGFETQVDLGAGAGALAIRPLLELLGWPARWCDHGAADGVERIDEYLARDDGERPLFLFVNLLEAHWRHLPPLAERIGQTEPVPGVWTASDVSRRFYGPLQMAGKRIDGPLQESIGRLYAAAVAYQDGKLGELIDVLRRRIDLDRAVVVVTSDHGENLGEGGRWDHVFAVNDALLHVPLVIRHPPAFPPGARIDGLCQLVDLPGTLLGLATRDPGARLDEGAAGRSLVPERFDPRDVVLAFGDPYLGHLGAMEAHTGFSRDVLPFAAVQRAIRDSTHKLVRSSVRGEELFDLASDPDETRDAAADAPARRDALRARLDEELARLPAYRGPPQHPAKDVETGSHDDARLRALGYVSRERRR